MRVSGQVKASCGTSRPSSRERRLQMKTFAKTVLGSLMVAGAAVAMAAPASAGVGVSVNLGLFGPPVVAAPPPPPPAYVAPPYCYGAYYYANCGFQVYGEPVFWNGYWYNNAPYRMI